MGKNTVDTGCPQMTIKYGACALLAGYLRLQTHTQYTYYLLLFHGNGYTNVPEYLFVHFLSCSLLQLLFCLWACSLQVRRWRALAGHYALCYWPTAHSPCWETTSLPTACTDGVPLAENWLTGSCLSAPASTQDTKQSACGRRYWRKAWYLMVIWGPVAQSPYQTIPPTTPHGVTVTCGPGPSH